MNTVERVSAPNRRLEMSNRPVMVEDWAEYLADLERARSRRQHPSNREPAWAKDGGDDGTEWDI
jgi:hypothetical protein